jgi:uncharacterized protein (TIGR00251 family)
VASRSDTRCCLAVRVIPRAGKPGIAGTRDGALLVRLQSPPVEGAANHELVGTIARTFHVPKRDVTIVSGEHSRLKRVAIATIDRSHVDAVLRTLGIDPDDIPFAS